MVILREHILGLTSSTSRKINADVYIKDGIVYVNNGEYEYKYQNDCWFIKAGENWVNMQGGIPLYTLEENPDEDVFKTLESEAEDE